MHEGHIKLFRRLRKAPYYQDSQYVHVWVHLLLSVNWSPKRLKLDNSHRFIDLLPGQVLTSRVKLAQQTGIHRSKIDRILKAFEIEHQIEQQTFAKYRVISIINWRDYQCGEPQLEPQVSHSRATSEPQVSTKKKEEERKEREEGKEEKQRQPEKLSPLQVKDLYLRYAGVLQVAPSQLEVMTHFSEHFRADVIEEAFLAAGAARIGGKGFLGWVRSRMEGKKDEPEEEDTLTFLARLNEKHGAANAE